MELIRKRITAAVLAAAMAAVLAGCRVENRAETAAETKTDAAAVSASAAEKETQMPEAAVKESPETKAETKTGTQAEAETEAESISAAAAASLHPEVTDTAMGLTDKEEYYAKAAMSYAQILLGQEEAAAYPELQNALAAYNRETEEQFREVKERLADTYKEVIEGRPEEKGRLQLSHEQEMAVQRSDSNLLSFLTYTFAYYGGAHPDHFYGSAAFDPSTGRKLRLNDAVTDVNRLIALADQKLKTEYADVYADFYSSAEEAVKAADTENSQMAWTAGYEGITLYFNPYCLGPYAMGEQIVTVYYDEAPGLFPEFVTEVPDSYAVALTGGVQPAADAAGTGSREKIFVTEDALGEDNEAFSYTIHSGERSCRLEDWCYSQKSYLVKANGQYYVYIFQTGDNDHVMLSSVDLKTMVRNESMMFNGYIPMLESGYEENAEGYVNRVRKPVFCDPDAFSLSTSVDYLSTQSGTRNYHVGMNGWPVPEEEYYSLEGYRVLRVKMELRADVVSEDGAVTGTEILSPDTYLFFVRTDDQTFADLQKIDASQVEGEITGWYEYYNAKEEKEADWTKPVYRIREDKSSWPFTVDGIPEDEVFGGIMYAG